jgi:hypothetical protein
MTQPTPAIVQSKRGEAVVEADRLPDLATAIAQMQAAVGDMRPDDITIEFNAEQSGSRSVTHFRFRAYRNNRRPA